MSSTGMLIEVKIIIVVIILALGTEGIAIAATVTSNLENTNNNYCNLLPSSNILLQAWPYVKGLPPTAKQHG